MKQESDRNIYVVDHPMVQHKLTLMRDKNTSTSSFRALLNEISTLMAYEVTADLAMQAVEIETPLEKMTSKMIDGKKLVFVSILRAGNGILQGMLNVVPSARVGHIGLYRDPNTLAAVEYYFKLPEDLSHRDVILVDPMLATGHTAVAAIARIKQLKPRSLKFVCLVSCHQGIQAVHDRFPEVVIYTAAVDRHLDENAYILPGLGDAGDRIFGTK
jgi:uracil phosphoribosyltransferase